VIVIAHRLSTIRDADEIIVIKKERSLRGAHTKSYLEMVKEFIKIWLSVN
jgi:ABC-type transport system involved in Fe-S cluster assembly fused permease/ATPase subunit